MSATPRPARLPDALPEALPVALEGADTPETAPRSRIPATRAQAFLDTTKPGITRLVTMTSAVGFVVASAANGAVTGAALGSSALTLLWVCLGTYLSAAGANALNQVMERGRDASMPRTRSRAIPSGMLTAREVTVFAGCLCLVGLIVLLVGAGPVPALVSAACIVSYLALYTPMKTSTPLATFVGAIPGALPPMIGASAASVLPGWRAALEPAGVALFVLMMVWQIPHFLALAWMYRDDYKQGGYAVLSVIDDQGRFTAWTVMLWALALIPATLMPAALAPDAVRTPYTLLALVSGAIFLGLCLRLTQHRTRERARAVFLASVVHLPLILAALVVESLARAWF